MSTGTNVCDGNETIIKSVGFWKYTNFREMIIERIWKLWDEYRYKCDENETIIKSVGFWKYTNLREMMVKKI